MDYLVFVLVVGLVAGFVGAAGAVAGFLSGCLLCWRNARRQRQDDLDYALSVLDANTRASSITIHDAISGMLNKDEL